MKASQVLAKGLGSRKYLVFEAHIPFILHFMADYNIAGCNFIHYSYYIARQPLPISNHKRNGKTSVLQENTPLHLLSSIRNEKLSRSELEIDIKDAWILNPTYIETYSTFILVLILNLRFTRGWN